MQRLIASDRRAAVFVFLLVFAVYGLTLCRGIYTGDDGDFETAMATTGICHPTGYPLFTLLGKGALILLAPLIAEPAVRINLLTAAFGAGAAAFFFRFLAIVQSSRAIAVMMALVLAFAPTLWQQSLSCEVYSLTALFLCLCLWLCIRLQRGEPVERWLTLALGLSLTNNLTMGLFLPGIVAFCLGTRPTLWRQVPRLIPWFVAPLLLYLYLPLAAIYSHSPVLWGQPKTLALFGSHVSGELYRSLMFSQPLAQVGQNGLTYSKALWDEFGWWLLWLAPIGPSYLWRERQRPLLCLLSWIVVSSLIYVVNYHILDIYVYYLPSFIVICVWIAIGLGALAQRVTVRPVVAAVAVMGLPLMSLGTHWRVADKSGNYLEADFAQNILRSAPPNAVVLGDSSFVFSLWYEKWVKGTRPDVVVVNWNMLTGALNQGAWYYQHLRQQYPQLDSVTSGAVLSPELFIHGEFQRAFLEHAYRTGHPVLVVRDSRYRRQRTLETSLEEVVSGWECVPWGIGERLYPKSEVPTDAELVAENERLWRGFTARGLLTDWSQRDPLQRHIILRYAEALQELDQRAQRVGRPELADALQKSLAAR